jgi:hypothetical protein
MLRGKAHGTDVLLASFSENYVTDMPRRDSRETRHTYASYLDTNSGINRRHLKQQNKQTPWPLVRERTIPTDRPPLVDET